MNKLGFDDNDYSVGVENRAPAPNSWKWEIYRAGRSDKAVSGLPSHHGGGQQSRQSGTQTAAGKVEHLSVPCNFTSRILEELVDFRGLG
jgi:hypothetical protein